MLWARTRDIAWMLVILGTIVAYIEIIYSILNIFGIGIGGQGSMVPKLAESITLFNFILPVLRMLFFISAFLLMFIKIVRKNR